MIFFPRTISFPKEGNLFLILFVQRDRQISLKREERERKRVKSSLYTIYLKTTNFPARLSEYPLKRIYIQASFIRDKYFSTNVEKREATKEGSEEERIIRKKRPFK